MKLLISMVVFEAISSISLQVVRLPNLRESVAKEDLLHLHLLVMVLLEVEQGLHVFAEENHVLEIQRRFRAVKDHCVVDVVLPAQIEVALALNPDCDCHEVGQLVCHLVDVELSWPPRELILVSAVSLLLVYKVVKVRPVFVLVVLLALKFVALVELVVVAFLLHLEPLVLFANTQVAVDIWLNAIWAAVIWGLAGLVLAAFALLVGGQTHFKFCFVLRTL